MKISELVKGNNYSNADLMTAFKCANAGGMRRSHKTNTLVLIADHTKSFYEDNWVNGKMLYTGMGLYGDQSFYYKQNWTLKQSNDNGVEVHLFEVFQAGYYTYRGIVELDGEPYMANQQDSDGKIREVCLFPLKTK